MGRGNFYGMDAVRPMLEFRRLIFRYLINNPYLRQDYLTSKGGKRVIKTSTMMEISF